MMVLDAAAAKTITGPACVDGIGPAGDWQGYWQRTDASRQRPKLGQWAWTAIQRVANGEARNEPWPRFDSGLAARASE